MRVSCDYSLELDKVKRRWLKCERKLVDKSKTRKRSLFERVWEW